MFFVVDARWKRKPSGHPASGTPFERGPGPWWCPPRLSGRRPRRDRALKKSLTHEGFFRAASERGCELPLRVPEMKGPARSFVGGCIVEAAPGKRAEDGGACGADPTLSIEERERCGRGIPPPRRAGFHLGRTRAGVQGRTSSSGGIKSQRMALNLNSWQLLQVTELSLCSAWQDVHCRNSP